MNNKIKTYPEMNEEIKNILGLSDKSVDQYVVARLEELEEENQKYKESLEMIADESRSLYSLMDIQAPFPDKQRILSNIKCIGNEIAARALSNTD